MAALEARFDGSRPWPPNASDEVQFFASDSPTGTEQRTSAEAVRIHAGSSERPLHVVCAGLSYNAYSHDVVGQVTPRIYTRTKGETWVLDDTRARATRRALGAALAAYASDPDSWVANGHASAADLLSAACKLGTARDAVIVTKTFLSPFVPTKPWSEFSGAARKATFEAWNPNEHLCDLIRTIGKNVDLWVIHGSAVWPYFTATSEHIQRWILTPTLSYESQRSGSIETFWKTARREERPAWPRFPCC